MVVRVYSTITNPSSYTQYEKAVSPMTPPRVARVAHIAGGAGVARKRSLVTPLGVMTEIDDNVWDWLKDDPNFQRHVDAGFLKVMKVAAEPDKVAADMSQRDGSAPLVPNDFPIDKAPTVSSAEEDAVIREGGTPPTKLRRTKPLFQR